MNRLADAVRADVGLEHGLALPVWDALLRGEAEDLETLAQKASAGSARFRLPEGRDAQKAAHGLAQAGRRRRTTHRRPASRTRADDRQGRGRAPPAVDLPDRRDRRHLRGHPAGPAGRPRGSRRDRRDPVHRPVAARLRARGRHPGGVRRHLRDPGELPADAGGARRVEQGARPLRAADQLRQRPVHARDRRAGRSRAARHDAQRLACTASSSATSTRCAPSSTSGSAARCTPAPASSSTPARTTTSPPPTPSRPRTR